MYSLSNAWTLRNSVTLNTGWHWSWRAWHWGFIESRVFSEECQLQNIKFHQDASVAGVPGTWWILHERQGSRLYATAPAILLSWHQYYTTSLQEVPTTAASLDHLSYGPICMKFWNIYCLKAQRYIYKKLNNNGYILLCLIQDHALYFFIFHLQPPYSIDFNSFSHLGKLRPWKVQIICP